MRLISFADTVRRRRRCAPRRSRHWLPVPSKYQQNFEGATIGQQVAVDVTTPFTINMGSARKKKKGDN